MAFTVGIAGITGKVALCVVEELLKYPDVHIKGYCRNAARLPTWITTNPRINITQGQVDDAIALRSFAKHCDVIICAYLAFDRVMADAQKLLIDICEEEGVERYIASDYTIEFKNLKSGQFRIKDPVIEVKEYLETKKSVKGVHVLIGIFMETLFSDLTYLWDPSEGKIRYYGTGNEIWEMTTYKTCGQYVAHVAMDRKAVGFKRFLGDRKSTLDIAAEFESVYGKRPAVERIGSLEDLYEKAHPGSEQIYILTGTYIILKGMVYLEGELDNKQYPAVNPMTLKDFLQSHPISDLQEALNLIV